ncbi:MAG: CinA family protein [Bacilli bacterium]|nr:CinA family protein [Bacilli bacterium]
MENLIKELKEKGLTLGSVESLTGGLFAASVTSVPGASKVFKGALITYTAEEKIALANVKKETLDKFGVVSSEVALEMARGGREKLNVDICVSVTGNAGPTCEPGGKPVGEVHLGISMKGYEKSFQISLTGNRAHIQSMCVEEMKKLVSRSLKLASKSEI